MSKKKTKKNSKKPLKKKEAKKPQKKKSPKKQSRKKTPKKKITKAPAGMRWLYCVLWCIEMMREGKPIAPQIQTDYIGYKYGDALICTAACQQLGKCDVQLKRALVPFKDDGRLFEPEWESLLPKIAKHVSSEEVAIEAIEGGSLKDGEKQTAGDPNDESCVQPSEAAPASTDHNDETEPDDDGPASADVQA